MSEAPAETGAEAPTPEPAPAASPPSEEKTVPYDRFAEVNKQAQAANKELKAMQDRLQELEDRDKSELERERTQRERLQAELQDRETRLVKAERGGWVQAAAVAAEFHDPADAVARIDLSEVESEKDAQRAVKRLADNSKHLVRQEEKTPQIGRVLQDGQPVSGVGVPAQDPEAEHFLEELKQAAGAGWRSAPGLLDK